VLRDRPVRRVISRIGSCSRSAKRQMTYNSPMRSPRCPPWRMALGEGHMGQISVGIRPLPGSIPHGNQQ
jgi:hypothetical protein